MRLIIFFFFSLAAIHGYATNPANTLGRKIITLSTSWEKESKKLIEYHGLSGFCSDPEFRGVVYELLNEIHYYHALLYKELLITSDQHDQKKLNKVLNEMEIIERDYAIESFNDFFRERCLDQKTMEKNSKQYKSGFGVHSYHGKIYVMEEELRRYIEKLSKRIGRVKKHVQHLNLHTPIDIEAM
tara:strand:+ start:139 stop:693 length:555 start_codon:yes stop_codon:yes gene_type:complete